MSRVPISPGAPKAHTYLFISLTVLLALGGGFLLMQSGVIDAFNSSGLLAAQPSAP